MHVRSALTCTEEERGNLHLIFLRQARQTNLARQDTLSRGWEAYYVCQECFGWRQLVRNSPTRSVCVFRVRGAEAAVPYVTPLLYTKHKEVNKTEVNKTTRVTWRQK